MAEIFIGIDNGVTGSIAILRNDGFVLDFDVTPTWKCLNYTKAKQWVTRVVTLELYTLLEPFKSHSVCVIERPMINPGRWKATISAVRALEATQGILELLQIPCQFIDSREWQREMLPSGLSKEELKAASLETGKRLFPALDWCWAKDADGLLIAEYARRKQK